MSANISGGRVEREPPVIIPAGCKLRCLRDDIIVKALEWRPSNILAIAGNTRRTLRGEVVAVGPGHWPIRYNGPKGYRTEMKDGYRFQPTQVKVGDIVELGGLEIDGYLFQRLTIDGQLHVRCREQDIVGIHV